MEKEIKLTKKELSEVKSIEERKSNLFNEFSTISILTLDLEDRRERAKQELYALRKAEAELASNLEAKYGSGNINMSTGVFAPLE